MHTAGWPLDSKTYGGSFIYHAEKKQIYIGYVIGLDYKNPHLSPFDEFQRFKTHKDIKKNVRGWKKNFIWRQSFELKVVFKVYQKCICQEHY